jgi:GTP cyclohydrolase I
VEPSDRVVDRQGIVLATRDLLRALGEDPDHSDLRAAPERIADSWAEFYSGRANRIAASPEMVTTAGDTVILNGIDFVSMCRHHLLPFSGVVSVAYLPSARLLGFGDISRAVGRASAGLRLQEGLTRGILEEICDTARTRDALVMVGARHGCLSDRGFRQARARATTVAGSGALAVGPARAETLLLMGAAGGHGSETDA